MIAAAATALSGLTTQSDRVAAVAANVANQQSLGALPGATGTVAAGQPAAYQPIASSTVSQPGGGARTVYRPLSTPVVAQSDPSATFANDQGLVAAPNVDTVGDLTTLTAAHAAYRSNLAVLKTADEMSREVLKLTA